VGWQDATFCPPPFRFHGRFGLPGVVQPPGRRLRHRGNLQLWLDPSESTAAYRAGRSFVLVAPWT
jgi:hypothetical protein